MIFKPLKLINAIYCTTIILVCCNPVNKNENSSQIDSVRKTQINNLFFRYQKESQIFVLDNDSDTTIRGMEGTILIIPKHSFSIDPEISSAGKIQLELKEYYKKSEIILSGLSTTSDDKILISSGMLYLNAQYEGENIKLAEGKEIDVFFNDDYSSTDFKGIPFYGEVDSTGIINWKKNENIRLKKEYGQIYSIQNGDTLFHKTNEERFFGLSKFGWINSDIFYENENTTDLMVLIDSNLKLPNLQLVFKEINSIISGIHLLDNKFVFTNLPFNQKVSILAFKILEDTMYFGEKDIVITNENQVEKVTLKRSNIEEIMARLERFD
ncbi:MAG: hypothetical protein MI921_29400 [Cytophagales bacterium]|nr:hypothetical protein [Cytophagales bacterium]